jgi:transposase
MAKKKTGRMTTTESETLRNRAYELYMNTNSNMGDIAEAVGVGKDTVSEWSKRYQWKLKKAANNITREKNVSMMLVQINNLLEDINTRANKWPTAPEADTITKMTNNIRALTGRTSLPDYFNVQTEFLKFIYTMKPSLAKELADYNKEFLQSKARELDA